MQTQLTREEIIKAFNERHLKVIDHVSKLNEEQFNFHLPGKWTAGQQLRHLYLCLKPLTKGLASKQYILEKFGTLQRPNLSYQEVVMNYVIVLNDGGKAPDKFVPAPEESKDREQLNKDLKQVLKDISDLLSTYSEEELDTLVLPHPLLGIISLREMFYLMVSHADQHREISIRDLKAFA